MELFISGYLEYKNPLRTESGEIQSIFLGYLSLGLALLILPSCLIWVLIQDHHTLLDPSFKSQWHAAYSDISLSDRWSRSFYLIYILRRFIFLCLGFFVLEHPIFQIIGILFLNLAMTIFQGQNKPFTLRLDNRLEMANEFLVSMASINMMCFMVGE